MEITIDIRLNPTGQGEERLYKFEGELENQKDNEEQEIHEWEADSDEMMAIKKLKMKCRKNAFMGILQIFLWRRNME